MTNELTTSARNALTLGSVNCVPAWDPFPQWTGWPQPSTYTWPVVVAPSTCSGQIHVWSCGHTVTCQCGGATRPTPVPPVCPVCGL
jgi:hypothetical protein